MEHIDNDAMRRLICLAQQGDDHALATIVENNTGLVWSVVKRYVGKGTDMDDLYQLGSIGLIKAIRNFDVSYDVCFSTYAVPMIAGEIRRFLRDDGIIKISRTVKSNNAKIRNYIDDHKNKTGKEPGICEIASALCLDNDEVITALEVKLTCDSIDEHENLRVQNVEEEKLLDVLSVRGALNKLEEKEKQLIVLRYYREMTQLEVAKVMGMTQVQVCRSEKKILEKIKKGFDSDI